MHEGKENPFASPECDDSGAVTVLPELHGRVPGSVRLAMLCLGGIVLEAIVLIVFIDWYGGPAAPPILFFLTPLVLALLALIGLWRRSRLARQWSWSILLICAVLVTAMAGAMTFIVVIMRDTLLPQVAQDPWLWLGMLIVGCFVYVLPALLLWTTFIALGKPTAKQHFDLVCPSCHSLRTRSSNWRLTKVRCRVCKHEW